MPLVSNSISYLLPDCTNFPFKLGASNKRYLLALHLVGTVTAKGPLALSEARAPTMSLFGMLRAFQQLSALSSPAAVASTVNNTRMPTGGRIVNVNAVPGALKVSADASSSATLALTYRRRMTSNVRWQSGGDSCVFVCHFVDNDCVHIVDPVSFSSPESGRTIVLLLVLFALQLTSCPLGCPSAVSLLRLSSGLRYAHVGQRCQQRPAGTKESVKPMLPFYSLWASSRLLKRKRNRCGGRHDLCSTLGRLPIRSCITEESLPIALCLVG